MSKMIIPQNKNQPATTSSTTCCFLKSHSHFCLSIPSHYFLSNEKKGWVICKWYLRKIRIKNSCRFPRRRVNVVPSLYELCATKIDLKGKKCLSVQPSIVPNSLHDCLLSCKVSFVCCAAIQMQNYTKSFALTRLCKKRQ
jgi:hypothetical protein